MALMTTAEVKSILRISGTDYDTDIAYFLPLVEEDIIHELNNAFQDLYVYRETGYYFKFVRGDSDTADYVEDKDGRFTDKGFLAGMDIVVEGGAANVGLYTIASVSDTRLTMDGYGEFINQEQSDTKQDNIVGNVRISRVKWPEALKLAAAKMVWHLIDDAKPTGAQSERIDDYSITYFGAHAYPTPVVSMLNKFKRPRFG